MPESLGELAAALSELASRVTPNTAAALASQGGFLAAAADRVGAFPVARYRELAPVFATYAKGTEPHEPGRWLLSALAGQLADRGMRGFRPAPGGLGIDSAWVRDTVHALAALVRREAAELQAGGDTGSAGGQAPRAKRPKRPRNRPHGG